MLPPAQPRRDWKRAQQRAVPTPTWPPTFSTQPQSRHVRPQQATLLTQVDVPEGAAPDLPAQPVPVPNPQLHGGSSARPRPALPARTLSPHSPAVPDAIAALVPPLDTSETGSTVAAAPGKDGRGFPQDRPLSRSGCQPPYCVTSLP